MGVFIRYEKKGDDLYLYEDMYWTFEPNKGDAIRIWHLKNAEKCIREINELIEDGEDTYISTDILTNGKHELVIDTYGSSEFVFICEQITSSFRPYNIQELTDIILDKEKWIKKQDSLISRYDNILRIVRKYVEKEMDNKELILQNISDKKRDAVVKSKSQLDILRVIHNLIEEAKL